MIEELGVLGFHGCCSLSQEKYILHNGEFDNRRYQAALDLHHCYEPEYICKCPCHQDGKVCLC